MIATPGQRNRLMQKLRAETTDHATRCHEACGFPAGHARAALTKLSPAQVEKLPLESDRTSRSPVSARKRKVTLLTRCPCFFSHSTGTRRLLPKTKNLTSAFVF
jgi:hypothetical protein